MTGIGAEAFGQAEYAPAAPHPRDARGAADPPGSAERRRRADQGLDLFNNQSCGTSSLLGPKMAAAGPRCTCTTTRPSPTATSRARSASARRASSRTCSRPAAGSASTRVPLHRPAAVREPRAPRHVRPAREHAPGRDRLAAGAQDSLRRLGAAAPLPRPVRAVPALRLRPHAPVRGHVLPLPAARRAARARQRDLGRALRPRGRARAARAVPRERASASCSSCATCARSRCSCSRRGWTRPRRSTPRR